MKAKDAILGSMDTSDMIVGAYLDGLSDADLLIRPVDGANHIAWQLGHLIASERGMLEIVKPGASPALPEGFEAKYTKESASSDDPKLFSTKAEYMQLWKAQREATKKALAGVNETDLDETGEKYPSYAPSMGAIFNMIGMHFMMHAGQFAVVRRKLKLPIAI
jgi:hypothetical protein